MIVPYFVRAEQIHLIYKLFKEVYNKWKKQIFKKNPFLFDLRFSVVKQGNNYSGACYILVDEVRYAFVDEYGINSDSTPAGSEPSISN